MFAEIIIPLALPKNYTWAIPARFQALVSPGIRVEVLLGRNKKYAGIIKKITLEKPAAFEPKEILQVIDETPILHPTQLEFWEWIASYYMCTEGEVMQAAVPANLKLTSESILIWNEDRTLDFSDLTDNEYVVAEALHIKKELRLSEVQQLVDSSHVYPLIKKLIEKEVCFIWEALKDKYKAKRETFIRLSEAYKSEAALETPQSYFDAVIDEYEERRNTLIAELKKIEGVQVAIPKGSFYCIAQLPVKNSDAFAQWLLEEFDVDGETIMVAPAAGFYATPGQGKDEVRLAYVLNLEAINAAMDCLEEGLKAYKAL